MTTSDAPNDKHLESKDDSTSLNILHKSLLRPFYGFHHPKTKWMLTLLYSLPSSRKRLQTQQNTLHSYFEIPDNNQPTDHSLQENHRQNGPAFHSLASLYLNPLGIAIYTRNEQALSILLELKIYNFSDPCFIQRWWNKGEDTFVTDFSSVHVVALAMRRNFFESITLFMKYGFNPRERLYQVDHIQSSDQSKTRVFQDCLDQGFHIMNERPCLDIGTFFKIISDNKFENRYDPVIFEMQTVYIKREGLDSKVNRICSLFRLVIHYAHLQLNGSCSSTYLRILEIIQKDGLFRYISKEIRNSTISQCTLKLNHVNFCEGTFPEYNDLEIQRLDKDDISKLSPEEKIQYLLIDRNKCLSIMFLWCINISDKGRHHLKYRVIKIIVLILHDCELLVWFLKSSKKKIVNTISLKCCGIDNISIGGIAIIKNSVIEFLRYKELYRKKIFKEADDVLCNLFKKSNKYKNLKKKTKNANKKKRSPFLVIDSQTMHSWNSSKISSNIFCKEFPMFSVHQKMGEMISGSDRRSFDKKSITLIENDDDTIIEESNIVTLTNSLNSFNEQSCPASVSSETSDNPPPLVIRKFRSKSNSSQKIVKNVHIKSGFSSPPHQKSLTLSENIF